MTMCLFSDQPSKEGLLVSHHDPLQTPNACSLVGERPAQPVNDDSERRPTWTVARLSVAILLFVTFTDTAFKIAHAQMHRIESHDDYDALSMDVIRPAFSYQGSPGSKVDKPSIGLGSAAISSITDALSPILPFTGGVDLRRSELYTSGNVLDNLSSMVRNTYQAYANAKDEVESLEPTTTAKSSSKTTKRKHDPKKASKKKYVLPLSASEPFVSFDSIAELALEDIGIIFEYAVRNTQIGFNNGKFVKGLLPRVKTVIFAMDIAVAQSRGKYVKVSKTPVLATRTGEMDAFNFCAAMRVFAEWRILRQVPLGYKGYAVGMSLGQKDVVQNVVKIERAAHDLIDFQLELNGPESDIKSPSLRDILEFEVDMGMHPNMPRLTEGGGAMGILWVRRQLQYQTSIFKNILEVPTKYHAATDAVAAAYTQTYDKYHGWAVQKIFTYSFQASPKVEEIYKFMNPHRLQEVMEIARNMQPTSTDESLSDEQTISTDNSSMSSMEEEQQPPENFFHRIGWETEKIVKVICDNFANKSNKDKKKVRGGGHGSSAGGLSSDELEEFVCAEMSRNVHEHIVEYLKVAAPLLNDIAGLMDEMNMDDPTKV